MSFKEGLIRFGKAAWRYVKQAKIELLVILGAIVLDLVTKAIVAGTMDVGQSITLIPNFLRITYTQNTRAAFGSAFGLEKVIGDEAIRIIFLVITVLALGVFGYVLYRFRGKPIVARLALALILAGAFGNFVDRLFLKYVRDFIEFVYFGCSIFGSTSFAIFNLADAALTVGVVLFIIYYLILFKEPKKEEKAAEGTEEQPAAADDAAQTPAAEGTARQADAAVTDYVAPPFDDTFDDGSTLSPPSGDDASDKS